MTRTGATSVQSGRVPVLNLRHADAYYSVEVAIGTPPQKVQLAFDASYGDWWAYSPELANFKEYTDNGLGSYDARKSSTFHNETGTHWKFNYGLSASCTGYAGTDVVEIGGIKISEQTVQVPTWSNVLAKQSDGVFGAGLPAKYPMGNGVQPVQATTPIDTMIARGLIKEPLWAVALKTAADGLLTIGHIEPNLINGEVTEVNLDKAGADTGFWNLPVPAFKVNGKLIQLPKGTLFSTGPGFLFTTLDESTNKAIYAAIPGARYENNSEIEGWIVPTNTTGATVEFQLGNSFFQVPARELCQIIIDTSPEDCYALYQNTEGSEYPNLGDAFYRYHYVIHHVKDRKVGFARRNGLIYDA